jgi:hypothetical protein
MSAQSNFATPVHAPIGFLFHIQCLRRAVPECERWE